ncbi:MAG: hypothetical protein KC731_39725, partial [Myxococcales bacterium]|nr:hypothetical protein [Myxococcales bacterium]
CSSSARRWMDMVKRPLRPWVVTTLAAMLFFAGCGSEVTTNPGETGGTDIVTTAAGGGGAASCYEPDCQRSALLDDGCKAGFFGFACNEVTVTPTDCYFLHPNCINCIDWCCPQEDLQGLPTYTPSTVEAPPGDPPAACTVAPELNWLCAAESKPPRAVHCETEPTKVETGCIDSTYNDADYCTEPGTELPLFCCP